MKSIPNRLSRWGSICFLTAEYGSASTGVAETGWGAGAAFEANSLRALTQRVQQTAAGWGPMRSKKRSPINATSIATGPGHRAPERSSCVTARVALSSMGNPLTTTGRPSLNQDWIAWPAAKISLKIGLASINKTVG